MLSTTLNKIYSLSPNDYKWMELLNYLRKTQPDDEALNFHNILESSGLNFALWCCQSLPEHDKHWRLYAVWCARQVKHLMTVEQSVSALNVAERYANGQATQEEMEKARVAAKRAAVMTASTGVTVANSSAKAAAGTTELIAGLAARDAACSAADAASIAAGNKAFNSIPWSPDEFVYYCESNGAFDSARHATLLLTREAQQAEFLRVVCSISRLNIT